MSEKIKFIYHDDLVYEMITEQPKTRPQPAKNFIPEWYKNLTPFNIEEGSENGRKLIINDRVANYTGKKCIPMYDAFTAGYIVPLWSDVYVTRDSDNINSNISWRVPNNVFELHGVSSRKLIPPTGYDNVVYKYITWFRAETPPGYSLMVLPLAGHQGMPFYPIPAIIDTDKSSTDLNFPSWIRSDFEGVLEKGTPMAQIIPFKRVDWKSEFSLIPYETFIKNSIKKFHSNILNNYVRNVWSKKEYS